MPSKLGQRSIRSRRILSGLATLTVAASVGGTVVLTAPSASAQAGKKGPKPTTVVKVATRSPYGQILTTDKKFALYVEPGGTCTGSCLTIWPPLLMPKGKTIPAGTTGLGTVSTAAGLQVTYHSMPLYTFYTDTKKTENGENVGGFVVAQVSSSAAVAQVTS